MEQGEDPLVVFCNGFPESWYSWHHQLPAVSEAGFRAVALDMRGYGQTSQPEAIEDYSLSHLVGDKVSVVNGLGYHEGVVIGHDWGGSVAWHSALMRPDLFPAAGVLSVPFNPPMALPVGMTVGRTIEQPSLYIYGEYDLIAGNMPEAVVALPQLLPGLTDIIRCEGAGHWLQQECVEQVNEGLLKFLGNL